MQTINNSTNDLLKEELTNIYALETKEKPIILYKDYPKLYRACRAHYGSVKDALKNFGIVSIRCHNKSKKWNYEKIEKELLLLLNKQNHGETFDFSKDYQSLKSACRRYFGTVEKAAQFFGLENKLFFIRGKRQYSWDGDKQKVIAALQHLYTLNPNGYRGFYQKERAVRHACIRIFGSVKSAFLEANIPSDWTKVSSQRTKFKVTKKEIILELQQLFIYEKLTLTQARKRNPFMFKMIDKHFKNLGDALEQAGIKYEDILVKNVRNAGILAERKIVEAILLDLGITFSRGFSNKIRPDFVFKNFWADAKISYYDKTGRDKTIKKYTHYTKQLVIIYIFGPDLGLHKICTKVLAAHINYYIKQLPKYKQIYYREQIEEIRQFYTSNETSMQEILELYTNFENEVKVEAAMGKITLQKGNYIFSIQSETWQQSFMKFLDIPINVFTQR